MKAPGLSGVGDTKKMAHSLCPQSVFNLPGMAGTKKVTTILWVTNPVFTLGHSESERGALKNQAEKWA